MPDTEMPHSRNPRRRFPGLWQVIVWGFSAAFAVGILAIVSLRETGAPHLEMPLAAMLPTHAVVKAQTPTQPAIKAPPRPAKAEFEIEELAVAVRQLTAANQQLKARIASLEHHLDDVTGSIAGRTAAVAPPAPARPSPPLVSAPAMLPKFAAIALPPREAPSIIEPLAMPPPVATAAAWSDASETKVETRSKNKVEAVSKSAARAVPMPRARPIRTASVARPRPLAPVGPELGIDIGGAMTVGRLNEEWMAVKSNFGPALASLYPIIGRDHHFGHMPYRLLIGPVPSGAEAARLCATLITGVLECRPARFEGEQLAQH